MMRRLLAALFVLLALCGAARAQTGCTVQTQAQLLQALRDNAPPGSVTPQVLRNLACSALLGGGSAGAIFGAPPALGNITPNTGAFTDLNASGKLTGKSITWLNAVDYGVVADATYTITSGSPVVTGTPRDVALSNAINACAARGATLILPPGFILLSGQSATTSNLQNCPIVGSGSLGGTINTPGSYGTMFLLTSTTVKPFNIGNNWSITGVNFFWPNQTTGTQFYPPLFSPSTETASTRDWYLDHVNLIDCYDCIVTGGGRFNVTDSNIYAMRDAFRVGNIGDSFRLTGVHFTPGPWFTMTNDTAPYLAATANNVMIHAQAGGNNAINFAATSIGAFSWHQAIKIDSGATVGISEYSAVIDSVDNVIDASSGGVWAGAANSPIRGTAGCNDVCFKMGANSTLYLSDWVGGSAHSFIETSSSNIFVNNLSALVGHVGDVTDYYVVHATANTGGLTINVKNSVLQGVPSSTKVHGIKTDVAATRVAIQNNAFTYFNDDIDIQSAPNSVIGGNSSVGTQGAQSIVLASLVAGGHGISYYGNVWDKPPQAAVASCGTGCTVQGGFAGFIAIGSTNPTTGFSLTLPFVPIGPGGGGCNFTPSIAVTLSGAPTGTVPTWNVGSSADIHGAQVFYNCGGIAQQ